MEMLLNLIPKPLLVGAIAILLGACAFLGYEKLTLEVELGKANTALAEAKEQHAVAVSVQAEENARLASVFRQKEAALQTDLDIQKETLNAKITSLAAQRDALKLRLAQPQAGPSAAATAHLSGTGALAFPGTPPGNGNRTLVSGQVGQLVDEAFRADQIKSELLGCYAAYERAQQASSK